MSTGQEVWHVEVWIGLIGIVAGATVGGAATWLTTRNRIDLEQRATFDRELRNLRLPHYQALHHISEALPREWRLGEEPTRADLQTLRQTLHEWYFGPAAGGMFLTEDSRARYFDLMNKLQMLGAGSAKGVTATLTQDENRELLGLAHDLRQQLRQDLGTAEPPKTKWTAKGLTPAPPPAETMPPRP
jgi:hypothetical protein